MYLLDQKRTITFNGNVPHEILNMMDDILYFKGFTGCFLSIISTAEDCPDMTMPLLFQWVKEKNQVMVLKLNSNNDVVCFAVLHEIDFDPMRQHKKPYVMDYIYTYEKYRNNGHAQSLINDVKTKYQFTAFCDSKLSESVFKKCNLNLTNTPNCKLITMARTK